MQYIVHGFNNQNHSNFKLTLEPRVCRNDEQRFDLILQILITHRQTCQHRKIKNLCGSPMEGVTGGSPLEIFQKSYSGALFVKKMTRFFFFLESGATPVFPEELAATQMFSVT